MPGYRLARRRYSERYAISGGTLKLPSRDKATLDGTTMLDAYSALREAGTAVIADVFDSMRLAPPVLDNSIGFIGAVHAFAGPAYTVTGERADYTGGDAAKLEAIDAMPPGVVAVWAGMDAVGVCCFGDLLATSMVARGGIAAVVDGGIRDAAFMERCGMPVMARYRTPAQGVGRWRVTGAEVPVRLRGALAEWIAVEPGDAIIGDADGVIVVPKDRVPDVVAKVLAWAESETEARQEIANGMPLLKALAKYGHL